MEKINKYISRFFKKTKMRNEYDMNCGEWMALSNKAKEKPIDAIGTVFLFGYIKGFCAANAEMKKGGAA